MNKKSIKELLEKGIISDETAQAIRGYYEQKESGRGNRLLIAFAIIGALLISLGVILILAHNWDEFGRTTKVILAFIPLLAGQLACVYALRYHPDGQVWKEGVSVFLFFAVGAVIALIGQIYNLPGTTSSFILTWMILIAPLIYIMDSMAVSLFFILGVTYYVRFTDLDAVGGDYNWKYYWLLMLVPIPFYIDRIKKVGHSFSLVLHHWEIPLSLALALSTLTADYPELILAAFMCLFGIYYSIGGFDRLIGLPLMQNGYRVIGTIGSILILFPLTFSNFWEELAREAWAMSGLFQSIEFMSSLILFTIALYLLFSRYFIKTENLDPIHVLFIVFAIMFGFGVFGISPRIMINLLVLLLGVYYINMGNEREHFGILNFGMMIVTILIACRFFDFEISYIVRGLLFVLAGLAFFLANYWMYKRRGI